MRNLSDCFRPFPAGRSRLIAIFVSVLVLIGGRTQLVGSEQRRTAVVKAVEGARDAIVNIHGQKTLEASDDPAAHGDGPRRVNGMGTGVIIDDRGYIITNLHVVDGVQKIEV